MHIYITPRLQSLLCFLQTAPSISDVCSWCSRAGLSCPVTAYCCCLSLSVSVVWLLKASFVFSWAAATKRRVCPLPLTFNTQGSRSERDLTAVYGHSLSLFSQLLSLFLSPFLLSLCLSLGLTAHTPCPLLSLLWHVESSQQLGEVQWSCVVVYGESVPW